MVIYLVRHTTPDVEKGVCYGQSDLGGTETFFAEGKEVKRRLQALGCSESAVFISSPLQRCYRLASLLSSQKIKTDARLMEMDFGSWELRRWDEIDENALRRWSDDFVLCPCPGGESYQIFYDRVVAFLEELKRGDKKEAVLVTHGGVIRCVLAYLGKTTLETSFEVAVDYGSVFREEL